MKIPSIIILHKDVKSFVFVSLQCITLVTRLLDLKFGSIRLRSHVQELVTL